MVNFVNIEGPVQSLLGFLGSTQAGYSGGAPKPIPEPLRKEVPRASRIVVADDDCGLRQLLAFKLRRRGYEVVDLANGLQLALHLIAEDRADDVDLVISDIRMPGLSGLDLLAYLGIQGGRFPPIVLITGFGDWRVHKEAQALGAVAVFDKPVDFDDLVDWVNGVIPVSRARDGCNP